MKRMHRIICSLVVCLVLLFPAIETFAQSVPIWTGSITCQLDDEEQGVYQRQEIQTWTLTGAPPENPTSIPLYQATWQAQAQGQLLRTQAAQTTSIQWVANVPTPGGQVPAVPIAIRFRPSDGKMIIGQWRSPMTVPNAVNGQRQVFINGVAQGQPAPFSRGLAEWTFPRIEAPGTDSTITGSSQGQVDAGSAELVHHYGGLPPTATCKWNLTKGGSSAQSSSANSGGQNNMPSMGGGMQNPNIQGSGMGNSTPQSNGQNCQTPATVQQSFETMKTDLQNQYDKLIQNSSDPNQIASLKNQEQRMIASLNNQEQHDMTAASQGCLQASGNTGSNPYAGGAASGGAAGAGAGASASGGAGAAGGANSGSNSNAGGAASGGAAAAGAGASASGGAGAAGGANSGSNPNAGGAASGGAAGAGAGASNQNAGNNPNAGGAPNGSSGNPASPVPPARVTATAGDSSAVVSWTASTGSIASYLVQTLPSGPISTTSANQLTIPGLVNGTTYTFQIIAVSSQGLTSSPVVSNPVTPMSSSAPAAGSTGKGSVVALQPSVPLQTSASGVGQKLASQFPASLNSVRPGNSPAVPSLAVTLTGSFTHFADGKTTATFVSAQAQPGANSGCVNSALNKAADSYAQILNAANPSGSAGTSSNSNSASNSNSNSCPPAPVQVSVKVNSPTSATATLKIDPSAPPGGYNVTVTTPQANGQEVVSLNNSFYVVAGAGTGTSPAPASAKYRAVIAGLMCIKAISSNDAIYAGAVVRQYDRRNNQNTMFTNLNTWVYGDINGLINQRKQAGTRGPLGGIGSGDFIPTGFMPGIRDTQPTPQLNNLLPLTLWEGTLTDGVDAVVISPSLWINYGDNPLFTTWNQNQDSFTNSIFTDSHITNQINTQTLGVLVLGPGANVAGSEAQAVVHDAATVILDTILVVPFIELQGGPSHDRPVGLADANPSDPTSSTILPNTTLVLTREIIEKRLGTGSWTLMQIDLKDTAHSFTGLIGADRPGEYMMFVQIERQ